MSPEQAKSNDLIICLLSQKARKKRHNMPVWNDNRALYLIRVV